MVPRPHFFLVADVCVESHRNIKSPPFYEIVLSQHQSERL